MHLPVSTLTGVDSAPRERVAAWCRRILLLVLLLFVLAGAAGLLGVRTTTSRASAAGYELSLRHATVARAGSDVPWEVTVTRAGGFTGDVTLAVTGGYFDIYETQGFHPAPAEETRDGDLLFLTFTAPPGETLVVAYDAYIQPSSQVGAGGTVSVLDERTVAVSVDFDTMLLP